VGAAQSAQQLVDAFPKSPRAYLALATVQQQMGNEAEGRRTLQRAIALAPDFSPAYAQLAFSYILSQPTDPAAAEPLAKKLIALEPREGMPYVIQGGLDRAINRLEPARQAYTRAAQLDPKNATTLLYLGHVDSFLGNFDAARADYDAAAKLSVANDAEQIAKYRALVAVHAGDSKRGIAELDQLANAIDGMTLADRLGGKIDALNAEFIVATQAGDFAGAARAIAQRTPLVRQQAAQTKNDRLIAQGEADIAYDDGLLAAKQGDFATAKAKAAEIMRLVAATQDPQKDQPAHALLGVVALEQKDYTGALEHFAHANPNDTYIWYERAVALEGAGKTDEAKALFRRVGSYNFNDPNIAAVRTDAAKRGA
ncbi:MAG TPA: tetratricopeptide repeat protein, partial [Candidatus Elarobacter sp.]|nr:tetratricopeptide repeat protein [Candidatus Elarobacter sp.]